MIYTIERHRPLLKAAEARFATLKLHNIVTRCGDGMLGWPEQAPFDRILLTAAVAEVPQILVELLKPGGIIVAPVGGPASSESISQHLVKIMRTDGATTCEALIPVAFVPMVPGLPKEA
jgi:protein-L-isoaspartate(D-aspartate) O-methyltransferase